LDGEKKMELKKFEIFVNENFWMENKEYLSENIWKKLIEVFDSGDNFRLNNL